MKHDDLLRASARCWRRAGRLDRAAERFATADAWAEAGSCWAEAGRPVDAAEAYGRADEPVFEARQWLTSPWPERARRPYRRALETGLASSDEVEALLGLGELDLALERSLGLPEDDGQRLEALRGVAGIAAARGRPDLASRAWAQAIARSPGSAGELHRNWERSSPWNRSLRWERPASCGGSRWPSRTFIDVRLELVWEKESENGCYGNRALAWSADGRSFAAARGPRGFTLGEVFGQEVRLQSVDQEAPSVDFPPEADSVLVGFGDGRVVRVDGSGSYEEVDLLRMPEQVWGIAFSPPGDRVAVTSGPSTQALLRVWSWDTQGPRELLREEETSVRESTNPSCAWSPDGRILAWCPGPWDEDVITNDVYLLSPEEKRCVSAAHENKIDGLSFSPDGSYLLTASSDRTLVLRDARTGDAIATPWSCAQRLKTSVFHPQADLLAAGGSDGFGSNQGGPLYLLRVSLEEHPKIEIVQEHATGSSVMSVAFSPNGEQLLMMTTDRLSLFRVHLI